MARAEPVWDDYEFSYSTTDDGIHITHATCKKEIYTPEDWLTAGLAKCLIEEHAKRCIKLKKES